MVCEFLHLKSLWTVKVKLSSLLLSHSSCNCFLVAVVWSGDQYSYHLGGEQEGSVGGDWPQHRPYRVGSLCCKMLVSYCIIKGKTGLWRLVHKKTRTCTTVSFTQVDLEDKGALAKLVEALGPITTIDGMTSTAAGEATSRVLVGKSFCTLWRCVIVIGLVKGQMAKT